MNISLICQIESIYIKLIDFSNIACEMLQGDLLDQEDSRGRESKKTGTFYYRKLPISKNDLSRSHILREHHPNAARMCIWLDLIPPYLPRKNNCGGLELGQTPKMTAKRVHSVVSNLITWKGLTSLCTSTCEEVPKTEGFYFDPTHPNKDPNSQENFFDQFKMVENRVFSEELKHRIRVQA